MFSHPLAIVDLETTGVGPARDRVIEVGVCLIDEGGFTGEWSSLDHPQAGRFIPRRPRIGHFTRG